MKALMLPKKEPTIVKNIRKETTIKPVKPLAIVQKDENILDLEELTPFDLNPVGGGSALDDFFIGTSENLEVA